MTATQPQTPLPLPREDVPEHLGTVIVGGGQAGLATAYRLSRRGIPATVLDARARTGDAWRERYDSLHLFSPAWVDGLPGTPFPAPKWAYPSGRELADYLESYAEALVQDGTDLRLGVRVDAVDADESGGFRLATGTGALVAENVVIATGYEARAKVPDVAREFDPGIRQLHSSRYRNPDQLLPGPVLVVGSGTSGADLAVEAAHAGHETWLSGRHPGEIPVNERLLAPFFWFAANHVLTLDNPIGRRAAVKIRHRSAPLMRVRRAHIDAAGVHRTQARTTGASDGRPQLADGTVLDVANVLWATGFEPDYSFVHAGTFGEDGYPDQHDGAADGVPGLYYMGLVFQRGFYSHLVGGVGKDARRVAATIAARARAAAA